MQEEIVNKCQGISFDLKTYFTGDCFSEYFCFFLFVNDPDFPVYLPVYSA